MADRIVEVEYLMADMAKSCCRCGNQNPLTLPEITPLKTINLKYGDDDEILKYCTFNETTSQKNVSQFISISKELLINALQKLHFSLSNGKIGQARSGNAFALTKDGDVMPCESIWNPFCCAAEICADMMVEMIELMANGADWMTEMCIAMIDEIGYLADDILKTEENIILMGYNIGYMADCIVVFIDQGLEFMTLFCPAENQYYSWRGHFTLRSSYTSESEGCSSDGQKILRLRDAIQTYSPHSIILKISSTIGEKWAARQQYRNQVLFWKKNLQSNPFGEFAQMVGVMMEAMTTFMKTMDKQTEMINQMMNTLTTFAQEESKMSLMVIEMAADVEQLENEVNTQEDLMVELTNCKN